MSQRLTALRAAEPQEGIAQFLHTFYATKAAERRDDANSISSHLLRDERRCLRNTRIVNSLLPYAIVAGAAVIRRVIGQAYPRSLLRPERLS